MFDGPGGRVLGPKLGEAVGGAPGPAFGAAVGALPDGGVRLDQQEQAGEGELVRGEKPRRRSRPRRSVRRGS